MEFQYSLFWYDGGRDGSKRHYYTFLIKDVEIDSEGQVIMFNKKVKHLPGKKKKDVEAVRITDSWIFFVPDKIAENFRNLRVLEVNGCWLSDISSNSLLQFSTSPLQELLLPNNSIECLPADLFRDLPYLKILDFRNNKIKYIHHKTLDHLNELTYADFRGNINIDDIYVWGEPDGITFSGLNAQIALYCNHPVEPIQVPSYIHSLWRGDFSDFAIKVKEKVFKVHKCILAANSPVFAAMFSHEMAETLKNEMEMENVSSESVKEFLKFLYFQKVPEASCNAMEIFILSKKYLCEELSEIVKWLVVLQINAGNVSEILNVGVLHNNETIKKAAFQQIQKSFCKKLPETIMDSVEDMADILKVVETIKRFTLL